MKKLEKEIIGLPVSDYEGDYIHDMEKGRSLGITGILQQFDVIRISSDTLYAFSNYDRKTNKENVEDEEYKYFLETLLEDRQRVLEFRRNNKKLYPTTYKIKLSIEIEELTEEETNKLWKNYEEKYK